ncbi:hypothetical protein A2W14_06575 [Candidatus Gottesmanbacteria bacterium RBG_16_37_8]|uniref:Cohesin domain-containing protein n=1 Tax=Candidatus Gottesmanbacteria bacterium RBG_16_37_8 TaxID=1798371 RepID=A0A1F5YPW1_9BACT|nr:MAG: hypothetical protein A2W14_06575 [Candidatus Gottesmanbacteria bacterium RBG_16_37_8]
MISKSKKTRSHNRMVFLVAVFFILGLVVSFAYQKYQKSKTATTPLAPNAILSLVSDKEKVSPGEEFTVTMSLDSDDSEVAAADFVVQYNPKYLKVVSVATGKFFNNYPINITGSDHVRISGVASFDGNTLVLPKGSETVGYITFSALGNKGRAVINIDKIKTVVATSGQDILDRKNIKKIDVSVI